MKNTKVITEPGIGTVVEAEQIIIPDLWHIVEWLRHDESINLAVATRKKQADEIIETWHLAHAMRKHIAGATEPVQDTGKPGKPPRCVLPGLQYRKSEVAIHGIKLDIEGLLYTTDVRSARKHYQDIIKAAQEEISYIDLYWDTGV
jgi:hypothetical protein